MNYNTDGITTTLKVYQTERDRDIPFKMLINKSGSELVKVSYRDRSLIIADNRIVFCTYRDQNTFRMSYLPHQWGTIEIYTELPDEVIRHCVSRLRLPPYVLKVNGEVVDYKNLYFKMK